MKFWHLDLIFLVIFCLFLFFFLRSKRKKIKREGLLFLYKTKAGINFIEKAAKKLKKILPFLGWISIFCGFLMMFLCVYLLIKTVILMTRIPLDVPPILPLVPYLPQAFKLPLPPFYFFYWIIIIVVIGITHEFSHGIFAIKNNVKIKSTGFGFLGPFLAAFVEPDEKQLAKKSKKAQLEIFSAGSFSNLVFAIIFLLLLHFFLIIAYKPAGILFTFAYSPVNVSEIKSIHNYSFEEFLNLSEKEIKKIPEEILEVKTENKSYYLDKKLAEELVMSKRVIKKYGKIIAYEATPAFEAKLKGGLISIEGQEVKKAEDVSRILENYKPGDKIKIKTSEGEYLVTLAKHPYNESKGYLGIAFPKIEGTNKIIASLTSPFFNPEINVKARGNEKLSVFFRDLFFWLSLVCFFVAIFNMLPLGFLDGKKMLVSFFLLITKSKKKTLLLISIVSYFLLFILSLMLLLWLIG